MELVIKPTNLCNFACSFCSSNKIAKDKFDIQFLKKYILENHVRDIIVNGGDPLMMSPDFYYDLISFLDSNNLDTSIGLTTNLWDFYQNPDKWKDIFLNQRIGIATSFQYGAGRYLKNGQPFTQALFLKVQNKFYQYFNRYVDFISVITDQNQDTAIDNILLAKKLNVQCKLNGANASGRQKTIYNPTKLYKIYLDLLKSGLYKWQFNTKNLINYFHNKPTICPLADRRCIQNIRTMQANLRISTCPALDDDDILDASIYKVIKNECYPCQYFMICNGCMKHIKDLENTNFKCQQLKIILNEFNKQIKLII